MSQAKQTGEYNANQMTEAEVQKGRKDHKDAAAKQKERQGAYKELKDAHREFAKDPDGSKGQRVREANARAEKAGLHSAEMDSAAKAGKKEASGKGKSEADLKEDLKKAKAAHSKSPTGSSGWKQKDAQAALDKAKGTAAEAAKGRAEKSAGAKAAGAAAGGAKLADVKKVAQGARTEPGGKKPNVVGQHKKYGPVMKGKRGGTYVMHNGIKYYGKYT